MTARSRSKLVALAAGAAGIALVIAACGGNATGTPTPRSLGGESEVIGFTPTPTAGVPPTRRPRPTATPASEGGPAATPASPVAAGQQVFLSAGCTACHTIDSIPEARGTIGPNLTTVGARAGQRVPGLSAEAYVRQSVLEPAAFVVEGFAPVMPAGLVKEGPDLDNLVRFLLSLGGAPPAAVATPTPAEAPPPAAGPSPTPQEAPGPPPAVAGNADRGRQIFLRAGCTACHTIDSIPEARGTIGPNLTTVGARAGQRVPGLSTEAYLRQSVLEPTAFVVEGFAPVMPAGLVQEGPDLDDLVAFLEGLQ